MTITATAYHCRYLQPLCHQTVSVYVPAGWFANLSCRAFQSHKVLVATVFPTPSHTRRLGGQFPHREPQLSNSILYDVKKKSETFLAQLLNFADLTETRHRDAPPLQLVPLRLEE